MWTYRALGIGLSRSCCVSVWICTERQYGLTSSSRGRPSTSSAQMIQRSAPARARLYTRVNYGRRLLHSSSELERCFRYSKRAFTPVFACAHPRTANPMSNNARSTVLKSCSSPCPAKFQESPVRALDPSEKRHSTAAESRTDRLWLAGGRVH